MAFLTWLGAWLQRHSGKAPAKHARRWRSRRGPLTLERLEERLAPAVGWSSAGNMATARSDATATLLGNGDVLVAGGVNGSGALSSAELYNPVSNSWSSAGNMVTARYFATATLLGDGDVLVAGRKRPVCAGCLSSAELYNPVSNAWSSAGNMATGRAFATATLLGNGKVLVAGGWERATQANYSIERGALQSGHELLVLHRQLGHGAARCHGDAAGQRRRARRGGTYTIRRRID